MKGVATSDWHLDVYTAGVDRHGDVSKSIDMSVAAAVDMGADFYLMCGDLTDPNTSRSHRAVAKATAVQRTLHDNGVWPIFVAGNHDVIEDGTGITTMSPLAATGVGDVFERPTMQEMHWGTLIALPYVEAAANYSPVDFIERCATEWGTDDKPVLIVGHLSHVGIHPGSETTDHPRGRDVMWPMDAIAEHFPQALVIGGHYHTPQVFNGCNIIGSLARLRFGEEADELGYMTVEF